MKCLLFLLALGTISCQTPEKKEGSQISDDNQKIALNPTYHNLKINDRVNSVVTEFIKEANCKNCINEMHVDKIRPDEIIIVLKSRVYSTEYLSKTNPLFTNHY